MLPIEQDEEQRRRLYETQCLKYQDGAHDSVREFDKAILTLSSGLLGLSLAFIKDVVPLDRAIDLLLLFSSWTLFGSSILFTLVSFISSQKAFQRSQVIAYEYLIEQKYEVREKKHVSMLVTRYLTYLAGLCFMAGLSLTLTFVIINVKNARVTIGLNGLNSEQSNMSDKLEKKIIETPLKKGVQPSEVVKLPPPRPVVVPPTQTPPPKQK